MSDKMFEEYGVITKSPQELIEEFATEMMMQHQIYVTEINFLPDGLDKITATLQPKERIKLETETKPEDTKISRMYSSAGRIKLGTAAEPRE
jgi:hypothetical protein